MRFLNLYTGNCYNQMLLIRGYFILIQQRLSYGITQVPFSELFDYCTFTIIYLLSMSQALLHSPEVTAWLQEEQQKRVDHTRMNTKRHSSAVGDCSEAVNQDISTTQNQSPIVIRPLNFSPPEPEHTSAKHYCDSGTVVKQDAKDSQANSCVSNWTHEQRTQNIGELSVPSKEGSAFKKFSSD